MKTLILVRHAKSSWAEAGLSDFDRPLNERGKRDAPEMARRIAERGLNIDLLLSSTAKRARKTASIFAETLSIDPSRLQLIQELYLASTHDFVRAIESIDDQYHSVIIFSHNPGITEFANSLTSVRIDDMPTCAVYALNSHSPSWKNFMKSDKSFLFFDYPKLVI